MPWYFWIFFVLNYFVMTLGRYGYSLPLPVSTTFLLLSLLMLVMALAKQRVEKGRDRSIGFLAGVYSIWVGYGLIQAGNMSSEAAMGDILSRWFAEFPPMVLNLMLVFFAYKAMFDTRSKVDILFKAWAVLTLLAVTKAIIQKYVGFDASERAFLAGGAMKTHFVNGIIRYFSFFTDAANFGCSMACSAIVFLVLFLTPDFTKKWNLIFGITSALSVFAMMLSGTRAAIAVFGCAMLLYAGMSRNFKAMGTTLVLFSIAFGLLRFTEIGQGNSMIRRMRSAFNPEDASVAVRDFNKEAMAKYLDEIPLGLGLGLGPKEIPDNNPHHFLAVVAPDSTWVYVHIHFGIIGYVLFIIVYFTIIIRGGMLVFFEVRDSGVRGRMTAIVCGASGMLIAGYVNQIMMQYPNNFLFFAPLAIVYMAPYYDELALEEKSQALIEEEEGALATT